MPGPADPAMAVSVAGRLADGVCPVLCMWRGAPVGVAGDAVAAAAPDPDFTPETPGTADCILTGRTTTQRNYWSGLETVLR